MRLAPAWASISAEMRALHLARVETHLAARGARDLDAVDLEQTANDLHIADVRHILQNARRFAEKCGNHRLRRQVLGPPHFNGALERFASVDDDRVGLESHALTGLPRILCLGVLDERVHRFTCTDCLFEETT